MSYIVYHVRTNFVADKLGRYIFICFALTAYRRRAIALIIFAVRCHESRCPRSQNINTIISLIRVHILKDVRPSSDRRERLTDNHAVSFRQRKIIVGLPFWIFKKDFRIRVQNLYNLLRYEKEILKILQITFRNCLINFKDRMLI